MKTKTIVVFFIAVLITNSAYSIDPAYEINVRNITNINPNTMQFDIYLKHTNPAQAVFLFFMGQFMFDFNAGIANGGTLSYFYTPNNPKSDLPLDLRPSNPAIINNQLRLAAQPNFNYFNGYTISSSGNGTLIARMRLSTTASSFAGNLNLTLRNSNSGGFYTKIYNFDEYTPGNFRVKNITTTVSNKKYLDLRYRLELMYPVLDSIKIRLRSSSLSFNVIDSQTVFASLSGTHFRATAGFSNVQSGTSYYIEAVHRNSIATWSANPVTFSSDTTSYNFTTSVNQAYNGNMANVSGVASIFCGDVTQNGFVDLTDVIAVNNAANSFTIGYVNTDLTGNGSVDLTDLIGAYNNSSKFVKVWRP